MLTLYPPVWYCAFWVCMLIGLYYVIKWAVISAIVHTRHL